MRLSRLIMNVYVILKFIRWTGRSIHVEEEAHLQIIFSDLYSKKN